MEETLYKSFGALLRDAREREGLSQEAVGNRVGLTRASISNIESGRQRFPFHMIYEFSTAVHVELRDLLPILPTSDSEDGWVTRVMKKA